MFAYAMSRGFKNFHPNAIKYAILFLFDYDGVKSKLLLNYRSLYLHYLTHRIVTLGVVVSLSIFSYRLPGFEKETDLSDFVAKFDR